MRCYLAGPMTGHPAFNFPAFDAAAADLRSRGYDVVSPAELDTPASRAAALASPDGDPGQYVEDTRETWGDMLARDVKLIADTDVEAIVVLPGWENSRGARLESFVGRLCNLPIYRYTPYEQGPWLDGVDWCALSEAHGPTEDFGSYDAVGDPAVAHPVLPQQERNVTPPTHPISPGEVRVTNAVTGGAKGTKPERMELLPWDVLRRDVAPLYAFGATKYEAHNYRRGFAWSLSFGAMMRHAAQFWHGEECDEETGCPHLASVVFHALALLLFTWEHPELDDRP